MKNNKKVVEKRTLKEVLTEFAIIYGKMKRGEEVDSTFFQRVSAKDVKDGKVCGF